MAQQLVSEGTRRLVEDNRMQVGNELRPLLTRIEDFRRRADEIHTAETGMQSDLRREIQQIQAMSTQLGTETSTTRSLNWNPLTTFKAAKVRSIKAIYAGQNRAARARKKPMLKISPVTSPFLNKFIARNREKNKNRLAKWRGESMEKPGQ